MNQFKKAKEKAVASGHKTEKVADLMTAGIEDKKEPVKKIDKTSEQKAMTSITEEATTPNKVSDITPKNIAAVPQSDILDSIEVTNNIIQNNEANISMTNINSETSQSSPEINIEPMQSIPDSTLSSIEMSRTIATNTFSVENTYEATVPPAEQPQSTIATPQTPPAPIIIEDTPSTTNNPIINEAYEKVTIVPQIQNTEIPIPIPVVAQPYIPNEQILNISQPQPTLETPTNQYTQIVNNNSLQASTATAAEPTAKKKLPNIFAPKEEAKSMRKSLVLKPTSVKKAENYCSKNGGSFNELIQTLLDNFIDEYGL